MLGGADNPNGELPAYITGADIILKTTDYLRIAQPELLNFRRTA